MPVSRYMVFAITLSAVLSQGVSWGAQDIPYGVGSWPRGDLGNHCARVLVGVDAGAVRVHVPWRLRVSPEDKDIIIVDVTTGKRVANVARIEINREFGDLAFEPVTAKGEYTIYYFPHRKSDDWQFAGYATPQSTADSAWLAQHGLGKKDLRRDQWKTLPRAKVVEIQARTEFDRFDPMEVVAHSHEVARLLTQYPGREYLLFPEDREHPIRMLEYLPLRWIRKGSSNSFRGKARPGEFYVFQIGLYAAREDVQDLDMVFDVLQSENGRPIPPSAFRCFNLGGVDAKGARFRAPVSVEQGNIQPLWVGVQIPSDATGAYTGTLEIVAKNALARKMNVSLTIDGPVLPDAGDSDLWRLSRLRWLDSTIAQDDEVTSPYTPLKMEGQVIACLGREVRFGKTGLPEYITSNGKDILANPFGWLVDTDDGRISWKAVSSQTIKSSKGTVLKRFNSIGGGFQRTTWAKMEFDGYVSFRVIMQAERSVNVKNIRLEIPLNGEMATYMIGMGNRASLLPKLFEWTWREDHPNNQIWIGEANAGIWCKLHGPDDVFGTNGMPPAWVNNGQGRVLLSKDGNDVVLSARSGSRKVKAGDEIVFHFSILPTPLKPLDYTAHWNRRFWNASARPYRVSEYVAREANRGKIHHGGTMNPHINYPFTAVDKLKPFIHEAHKKDIEFQLYYTVRELSNRCAELWVLRSLGHEVIKDGPGGGDSWLREHLVSGYKPAWQEPIYPSGEIDAAVAMNYRSRWHNYYLEGLAWLLKDVGIDGLYLDGIGYDRNVMQRVRKVLDHYRSGSEVDFHGADGFHKYWHGWMNSITICQHMGHLPYIDSLWFGEGYHYDRDYATPAHWLFELSGLPFGVSSDMLHGGGNPWKGMLYGMMNRNPGSTMLYRRQKVLWDVWDRFGIQDARMIGYWNKACPIKTSHPDIKATVFVKNDQVMIALASWANTLEECHLQIDWKALSMHPGTAALHAPQILDLEPKFHNSARWPVHYQEHERWFKPSDAIPVKPKQGWLLFLSTGRAE